MHYINKKSLSTLLQFGIGSAAILAVLFLAPLFTPRNFSNVQVSACTWVSTNCGSGCADNKDLYNCSPTVQVQSVTVNNTNTDSNAKAAIVAPTVVTQYIPAGTATNGNAAQEVANGNGAAAATTVTGAPNTAGQTANATSTYDATNAQITGAAALTVSDPCLVSNGTTCTQRASGAVGGAISQSNTVSCTGKPGFQYCAGSDKPGCYPTNSTIASNTPACSCAQITKQRAVSIANGGTSSGGVCDMLPDPAALVLTAVGGACNPGQVYCAKDYSGLGCGSGKNLGKKCGQGGQANGIMESACNGYDACAPVVSNGGSCSGLTGTPYFQTGNTGKLNTQAWATFVGCSNNSNCWCTSSTGSIQCVNDGGGTSCGVTAVPPVAPAAPAVGGNSTGSTNPPSTTIPVTPPAAPVCVGVSISKPNPQVGDVVTFACTQVTGVDHYKFQVKTPDGTIKALTASANVSQSYTIPNAGAFTAQCTICTGVADSTCQAF